jgi:hypothetical protein
VPKIEVAAEEEFKAQGKKKKKKEVLMAQGVGDLQSIQWEMEQVGPYRPIKLGSVYLAKQN